MEQHFGIASNIDISIKDRFLVGLFLFMGFVFYSSIVTCFMDGCETKINQATRNYLWDSTDNFRTNSKLAVTEYKDVFRFDFTVLYKTVIKHLLPSRSPC